MTDRRLLDEGIALFNQGRYYEAHEVWEDLWRILDHPDRGFIQGLIHAAVGLHHINRQNLQGGRAQLAKAVSKLGAYRPTDQTIDSSGLIQQLQQVSAVGAPFKIRIRPA